MDADVSSPRQAGKQTKEQLGRGRGDPPQVGEKSTTLRSSKFGLTQAGIFRFQEYRDSVPWNGAGGEPEVIEAFLKE